MPINYTNKQLLKPKSTSQKSNTSPKQALKTPNTKGKQNKTKA